MIKPGKAYYLDEESSSVAGNTSYHCKRKGSITHDRAYLIHARCEQDSCLVEITADEGYNILVNECRFLKEREATMSETRSSRRLLLFCEPTI